MSHTRHYAESVRVKKPDQEFYLLGGFSRSRKPANPFAIVLVGPAGRTLETVHNIENLTSLAISPRGIPARH